jgi:ABC-type multidrug transport system ATPase subunit/ABC-type polysaccharide/polyol phosphate export permease
MDDGRVSALSVRRLTKRYDDGTLALDGLDLEIRAGEFFGLLGPNGAGKTTLINAVCNLIRISSGEISVFGHAAPSLPARRLVGVAEQEPNLDRFLTVREALVYHGGYFGMSGPLAVRRAEEMIDVFDLRDKADVRAPKLSGGMRRRLLLARALLHEPRLVILDEPTAGVDIELRHELWRYIRRLHRAGTTILLTTHYLEEAEALCEDIALIGTGRIVARASAEELKRRFAAARTGAAAQPEPLRGLVWLSARECLRVLKLWTQTVLASVISSALFILVFGLSLGSRIHEIEGFRYEEFIVPGLIAMAMAQAAYSNNSSSIFQARSDRYINDVLAAPMRPWQMNLGLSVGGVFRALLIGAALTAIAIPLTGAPVAQPAALLGSVLLLVSLFGALGVVVGIYAETFDHHTFVNNIVILPLTFLGGVFYSVEVLPSPWHELSHANPLFYVVNTMRYGFLGISDVNAWIAFAVTGAIAAAMVGWSQYLFRTGRRLKP